MGLFKKNNSNNNFVKRTLEEVTKMVNAAKEGNFEVDVDFRGIQGDYLEIVKNVSGLIENFKKPLEDFSNITNLLAKGDSKARITVDYKGSFNVFKESINRLGNQINLLVSEMDELAKAAAEGNLDYRGDSSKFEGDLAEIVNGVNRTMEGVITPLRDIGSVIDRLAAGDSKARVTAEYKGDYNVLKVAANGLGEQINLLVQEMEKLDKAAAEGNLDYRGDSSKFKGDLAEIVNGVNRTMEGIVIPLRDIGDVLKKLANNDLTARVTSDYKGEYNILKENVNKAMESLENVIMQVADSVDQVSSASNQVSASSQALAQGASEQASALEETSSSLEEIASMTNQNADNANQANTLSIEANKAAEKGNEIMQKMAKAIEEIKKSSDETSKIIKTIDEIAFQTNLLALNAAVEAARAGEAGKGFAVVADEVRNLAMRSAEAAKNTSALIEESVKNAENGVTISQDVAESLTEINNITKKVSNLVAEIAASSKEQAQGVDQINKAVAQMDEVTQKNAATSEESASAAEELASQATELDSMVASFKLSRKEMQWAPAKERKHIHIERPKHIEEKKPLKKAEKGNGKTVHIKKKTETGDGKTKKEVKEAVAVKKAEEIIPMDDDDFKEF